MNAQTIFNEIKGINPSTTTVSSIGTVVTSQNQQIADNLLGDVIKNLTTDSLAYKIATSTTNCFTEKQLWVIAYELLKNADYCKKIENEKSEFEQYLMGKNAAKAAKRAAKSAAKSERKEREDANKEIEVGQRVEHAQFGKGIVTSLDVDSITVVFDVFGEKKLCRKLVKLQIL
jgi:hypothetical protein